MLHKTAQVFWKFQKKVFVNRSNAHLMHNDDCTSLHLVKRDNLHLAIRQSAAMMKTARPATPSAHPASTSDKRCRLWTIWCQNRSSDKSDRECGLGGNSYLLFHVSSICGARILYPRCITDLEIEFYFCMLTGMQYCHQKWVPRVIFV